MWMKQNDVIVEHPAVQIWKGNVWFHAPLVAELINYGDFFFLFAQNVLD